MRIIKAHNRYQQRGGEDQSFETECAILRENGHQVQTYLRDNHSISACSKLRTSVRTVWSSEDYQSLRKLIREFKPDVIHFHNTFPLMSPSVYYAAHAEHVPIVQTLPNFRLLCPSATLFRDGHICEDCLGKTFPYPGIWHACYRHSHSTTVVVATMLATHRLMKSWTRLIDTYIVLADFSRQKFIDAGLDADRIVVKPNFVHPDPGPGDGMAGYCLYAGRLVPEKGVNTLLQAWRRLDGRVPLKIVGSGPLEDAVKQAARDTPGIEWLGARTVQDTYELMKRAAFLVFPSEWYEPLGRSVIESFAAGTPVLAARIGAPATMVDDGQTGIHFTPGDPEELATSVVWLVEHPTALEAMRENARAEYLSKYTSAVNYRQLIDIYSAAVHRSGRNQ